MGERWDQGAHSEVAELASRTRDALVASLQQYRHLQVQLASVLCYSCSRYSRLAECTEFMKSRPRLACLQVDLSQILCKLIDRMLTWVWERCRYQTDVVNSCDLHLRLPPLWGKKTLPHSSALHTKSTSLCASTAPAAGIMQPRLHSLHLEGIAVGRMTIPAIPAASVTTKPTKVALLLPALQSIRTYEVY